MSIIARSARTPWVAHLPCYYAIDEDQMKRWYLTLAERSPPPVILYNIPVTAGPSMRLALVDDLSRHENIVGFKDSERGDQRLVPSSGNVAPALYRGLYDAAKRGSAAEADRLQAITDEISRYYQEGQILSRSTHLQSDDGRLRSVRSPCRAADAGSAAAPRRAEIAPLCPDQCGKPP